MVRAVLFDFGGVILSSPFEAFAAYEREAGLPPDTIRTINSTNPDTNAWARLERSELTPDEFVAVFDREARELGFETNARHVLEGLHGEVRPAMVEALRRVGERYATACLTNNMSLGLDGEDGSTRSARPDVERIMGMFDVVVESRTAGVRKPERRFYELACEQLSVRPADCVFLDDLGINLKPARAMGMTTIKVVEPDRALAELEAVLDMDLRS